MDAPKNVSGCPKNLKPLYIRGGILICSGMHRRNPKPCRFYDHATSTCTKEEEI